MNEGRRVASQVILCLILTLASLSIVAAQNTRSFLEKNGTPTNDVELLVTLKFILPSGDCIHATQREGGLIRIEKGKSVYLLTPRINMAGSVFIEVNILYEYQMAILTQPLDLQVDVNSSKDLLELNPLLPFLVRIEKIQKVVRTNINSLNRLDSQMIGSGECCVTCNGIRTCACAVSASCGTCCIPKCC